MSDALFGQYNRFSYDILQRRYSNAWSIIIKGLIEAGSIQLGGCIDKGVIVNIIHAAKMPFRTFFLADFCTGPA